MVELYPYAAPDGVELLIAWLKDVAETRTDRPAGAVLPWITVRRIGGGDDGLTDRGLYSIHSYASTKSGARALGNTVHRRILALTHGGTTVEISTGSTYVDKVVVVEHPRPVYFIPSIQRVVGTYQVHLRVNVFHES